jgi:hypothetical protein
MRSQDHTPGESGDLTSPESRAGRLQQFDVVENGTAEVLGLGRRLSDDGVVAKGYLTRLRARFIHRGTAGPRRCHGPCAPLVPRAFHRTASTIT